MIDRAEIKLRAKAALKPAYWKAVLVALILAFCTFSVSGNPADAETQAEISNVINSTDTAVLLAIAGIFISILAVSFFIRLFFTNILSIGCYDFFLKVADGGESPAVGTIFSGFKQSYFNKVLVMFVHSLIIGIGMLLFVIPGIIFSYMYRMVPYILAEDPTTSVGEALSRSSAMMKGHKMEAFIFDLSFIGWYLLAGITCGLVGLFYSNPYKFIADAELYRTIKNG